MEFVRETILHRATSTNIGSSHIVNNREELRPVQEDIPVHSVDADESDVNIVPITCISIASKRYARKCESDEGFKPNSKKKIQGFTNQEKSRG